MDNKYSASCEQIDSEYYKKTLNHVVKSRPKHHRRGGGIPSNIKNYIENHLDHGPNCTVAREIGSTLLLKYKKWSNRINKRIKKAIAGKIPYSYLETELRSIDPELHNAYVLDREEKTAPQHKLLRDYFDEAIMQKNLTHIKNYINTVAYELYGKPLSIKELVKFYYNTLFGNKKSRKRTAGKTIAFLVGLSATTASAGIGAATDDDDEGDAPDFVGLDDKILIDDINSTTFSQVNPDIPDVANLPHIDSLVNTSDAQSEPKQLIPKTRASVEKNTEVYNDLVGDVKEIYHSSKTGENYEKTAEDHENIDIKSVKVERTNNSKKLKVNLETVGTINAFDASYGDEYYMRQYDIHFGDVYISNSHSSKKIDYADGSSSDKVDINGSNLTATLDPDKVSGNKIYTKCFEIKTDFSDEMSTWFDESEFRTTLTNAEQAEPTEEPKEELRDEQDPWNLHCDDPEGDLEHWEVNEDTDFEWEKDDKNVVGHLDTDIIELESESLDDKYSKVTLKVAGKITEPPEDIDEREWKLHIGDSLITYGWRQADPYNYIGYGYYSDDLIDEELDSISVNGDTLTVSLNKDKINITGSSISAHAGEAAETSDGGLESWEDSCYMHFNPEPEEPPEDIPELKSDFSGAKLEDIIRTMPRVHYPGGEEYLPAIHPYGDGDTDVTNNVENFMEGKFPNRNYTFYKEVLYPELKSEKYPKGLKVRVYSKNYVLSSWRGIPIFTHKLDNEGTFKLMSIHDNSVIGTATTMHTYFQKYNYDVKDIYVENGSHGESANLKMWDSIDMDFNKKGETIIEPRDWIFKDMDKLEPWHESDYPGDRGKCPALQELINDPYKTIWQNNHEPSVLKISVKNSPELFIKDPLNRITGVVNNKIYNEVPLAGYLPAEESIIGIDLDPATEIVTHGIEKEKFSLEITGARGTNEISIIKTLDINPGEIQTYDLELKVQGDKTKKINGVNPWLLGPLIAALTGVSIMAIPRTRAKLINFLKKRTQ